MKDFDLNKIGKEMPYKAIGDDFFESFTDELLAKVSQEQRHHKTFNLKRVLIPTLSAAAALAIICAAAFSGGSNEAESRLNYTISEDLDNSINSFFDSLSDEELEYLALQSSYNEDFFTNLPDNK